MEQTENTKRGFRDLEILASYGSDVPLELLEKCFSNPNQFIRIITIEKVGEYCRKEFTQTFAIALNDRCDYVVEEAAQALAKINTDEALEVLAHAFFEGIIERPHHLANAISQFGQRGFEVLLKGTKNTLPNIRYYSGKLLGSTGIESAMTVLEDIANNDNEETTFTALVSSGARKGIKTLTKILSRETDK